MSVLCPRDASEVEQAVLWAAGAGKALEVVGRGSKRNLGRPAQCDATLDLSALTGVALYEPDELVLSAKAGTPLAEIEALCAASGQELAFEPMDYGPLLGVAAGQGTIGGALAVNASGPRRIKAGAARDHLLGLTAVSGRGETFKTGGRVVKNVTGYDLCKLMAGSFGTLAAMTEVTVKTLPRAETEASVVLTGLAAMAAGDAMAAAMGSAYDVSGAAHLPASVAGRVPADLDGGRSATVLRLEGVGPSVLHRRDGLCTLLRPFGTATVIGQDRSRTLWRAVRDVLPFAAGGPAGERVVWRLSTAPKGGAEIVDRIGRAVDAEFMQDWAGGLVWVAVAPAQDGGTAAIRAAITACGGHATLVRAPAALRAAVEVFEPQAGGLAALTKRIKDGFDPKGVLNPGRMWAGF
jgi:glycolate oxidase FAD binding subunit